MDTQRTRRRRSGRNAIACLRAKFLKKSLCLCGPLYRLSTMGKNEPRLSAQTLRVLTALLSSPRDQLSGAEIGREAKLASGTLYPILARLEQAGWLESRWETEEPSALGRPRRRFYRMTPLGVQMARTAFQQFQPALRRLAWQS